MADLGVTFTELRNAVSYFLGYGPTAPTSGTKSTIVDNIVKSGLRQVYWPPPLSGVTHSWSWLQPLGSITTNEPYDTGTVTTSGTTVTLSDGTFPSWVDSACELVIDDVPYAIASRDGDTQLTLESALPSDVTDSEYSVIRRKMILPDDFGRLVGSLTFEAEYTLFMVPQTSEGYIRELYQTQLLEGRPQYVAIVPKKSDQSELQSFMFFFYPIPDDTYTLSYRYMVSPDMLESTTGEHPYGSVRFGELFLESCLSVAEERMNDTQGVHKAKFMERLAAAISEDLQASPRYLGRLGKTIESQLSRSSWRDKIYYNGVEI